MTKNKKIIGKMSIDLIKGEFIPKFYLIDEGEKMTELDYKKHMCLYYNMKYYKGDISVKGQYNFRKRG